MKEGVRAAFRLDGIMLRLEQILPIRQVKPTDAAFGKYAAVLSSIREIGIIEPLIVHPAKGVEKKHVLLDGHLRLKALQELKREETFCLVAKDDDAFTYNDKVNRLSLIQEHGMIVRAVEQGVTPEQISKVLNIDVAKLKSRLHLLEGIEAEAVEILKDRPITATALRMYTKVHPARQVEMAQLMASSGNYTRAYAEALIVGTPADQLKARRRTEAKGIAEEDLARMQREMEALERDYRLHQDRFGENSLHLNSSQRHVKRLLDNPKVRKFLEKRYPEILEEFQELAELEAL